MATSHPGAACLGLRSAATALLAASRVLIAERRERLGVAVVAFGLWRPAPWPARRLGVGRSALRGLVARMRLLALLDLDLDLFHLGSFAFRRA
jgi:hypothetical protein